MSPPPGFQTTSFRKLNGGSLSKRISLRPDGSVNSDASPCRMTNGEAWRVHHAGLAGFADHLDRFQSSEALVLGSLVAGLPDRVEIRTKAALERLNGHIAPGIIARTQGAIVFNAGTPALLLLDFDTGGMPDEVRDEIARRGGFWSTLVSVLPALAGVGRVVRPSTSFGLSRSDTGATFAGSGGLHTYVLAQDGSDIPRFLRRLYDACWLAGFGWFKTAKDGRPLERSIVDNTVGDPSGLVFEGQPKVILPLVQATRRAEFFDGGPVDTSVLADLSDAQQVRLDALREAARQRWEGAHPSRPSKPRVARPTPTPRRLGRDDDDLEPVRAALRADAAGVAEALLGPPNKTRSNKKELRWGTKGGRSVGIAGPKRGRWSDYEAGKSGDILSLIRHVKGGRFGEAVRWARNYTGIAEPRRERTRTGAPASRHPAPGATAADTATSAESPAPDAPSEREPPPTDADDAAEAAAERAGRIAFAQRLVAISVPAAGTPAEDYLKLVRGIPRPAGGWPASIRWHRGYRALLAVATLPDGTVQAVQSVHLDRAGEKISAEEVARRGLGAVKMTAGPMDGAAVRFPGDPAGALALCEGVETGLAVHTATGVETWCALGAVGKLQPPIGRRVVVVADDNLPAHDAKYGEAARALRRAVCDWHQRGVDVSVIYPWVVRRHDKSDFADQILSLNAEAVRARVFAALEPVLAAPSREAADAVRPLLGAAVGAFFAEGASDPDQPPLVHAVRVDVGLGKSHAARQLAAETLAAIRQAGDKRTIVIAVPTHKLGDDQAELFEALPAARAAGLKARVFRGRDALDPNYPDEKPPVSMCQEPDRVADAKAALADVETACCRQRKATLPDGTTGDIICPSYEICGTQRQKKRRADLWFVPHQLLFGEKPAAIGDPAFVIVDESIWAAGLERVEGRPWHLTLDSLADNNPVFPDSGRLHHFESDHLRALRATLHDVLRDQPDGPLMRDALAGTVLTADACAEAVRLEWSTKLDAAMHPGMSRRERKDRREAVQANRLIPSRVALWQAAQALLAQAGPEASGWAALATVNGDDGPQRVLVLKGRKKIRERWNVPTLLLDANLPLELNRFYWPNIKLTADIRAQAPHQHVRQVVDLAYAKTRFIPNAPADGSPADPKEVERCANRLRELRATLIRESRPHVARGVLVVLQQAVEAALRALGPLPPHIEMAHHNAIAGRDIWRDVGLLIVVGRTQPSPAAVERLTEAITGRAVTPLEGWYGRRDAVREMTAGRHVLAEADFHPDPVAEAIRWQACEGELVQIVGRGRGVNRDANNPLEVLIMTDVTLPIPVDEEIFAVDLRLSPADLMLAEAGIAVANPADGAAIYPGLWLNRDAAKWAKRHDRCGSKAPLSGSSPIRDIPIGEIPRFDPLLGRVSYRVARRRKATSEAIYDPAVCPDPEAFLTERLGRLASCRVVPPGGQATAPALPPLVARAMAQTEGVLPLVPVWLCAHHGDLFTSERTAKRLLAELAAGVLPPHCRMAVYSVRGQFRPSKALVRRDVADPRAALERLLGTRLKAFRLVDEPAPPPALPDPDREPDHPAPVHLDRPPAPDPDGVAPEILGGYGDWLDPAAMFPRSDAPPPTGIWRTRAGMVFQTCSVSLHQLDRCAIDPAP
jgi:putative DNA primase/helicase